MTYRLAKEATTLSWREADVGGSVKRIHPTLEKTCQPIDLAGHLIYSKVVKLRNPWKALLTLKHRTGEHMDGVTNGRHSGAEIRNDYA